jgi:hypothetical protein
MTNRYRFVALVLLVLLCTRVGALETVFENSQGNASASYDQALGYYRQLVAQHSDRACMREHGMTDVGRPLVVAYFSVDGCESLSNTIGLRPRLLVMNAIHPGEAAGFSAAQIFARELLAEPQESGLAEVDVAILVGYNIGGLLNRGAPTRANQNGPEAYGFRGNAQNYDLNRDFIKADSRNALSFAALFRAFDPDLFLDTHTTNGADYQHPITLLATQADKLAGQLGGYWRESLMPALFSRMREQGVHAIPYVNVHGRDPAQGWTQFDDSPRYSSGYAALFQVPGIISETHMLKPFAVRVEAQRVFLHAAVAELADTGSELRRIRLADREAWQQAEVLPLDWGVDEEAEPAAVVFHGYASRMVASPFGENEQRRVYDREQAYVRSVPFRQQFRVSAQVSRPAAWVVPRGWHRVIERLQANQVQMQRIPSAQQVQAFVGDIGETESLDAPWEGHFYHRRYPVEWRQQTVTLQPGDWLIPSAQPAVRYLAAVLEPAAPDAFARWSFFDSVLGRKEYFSAYLFEDHALRMLEQNAALREAFEARKTRYAAFKQSRAAQLQWLYERSEFAEDAYRRYPILRLPEWPAALEP